MTGVMPTPTHRRRRVIAAGETLPQSCFSLVAGPGTVVWSQGRTASVIFVPHGDPCGECEAFTRQLAGVMEGLREWASRVLLLVPSGAEAAFASAAGGSGILLLADADGAGRGGLGISEDQAAVVQADRWGAVYDTAIVGRAGRRGPDHEAATVGGPPVDHADLPTPEALVALAKFIDIQCPECGVPSKEWLQASPFPLG